MMTIEKALEIVDINDRCREDLDTGACLGRECEDCTYNLSTKDFTEAVHVLYGAVKTDISKKPKGPAITMTLLSGGDEDVH